MGIGNFSDGELKVLDSKFGNINTQLNGLSSQFASFATKIQQLKSAGGTILDNASIQDLFDKVQKQIKHDEDELRKSIEAFRASTEEYTQKRNELLKKEEELIKKESYANADFAEKYSLLIAPIKAHQEKLEEKENAIIQLQEEYNNKLNERENKLIDDYKKISTDLENQFKQQQQVLIKERDEIAQEKNGLSERERIILEKENAIKNGLAQERYEMMQEIEAEKAHLDERKDDLDKVEVSLKNREAELEREKNSLQQREDAVYNKECIADEGFAEKKKEMLNEIEELRQQCLLNIQEEEKKNSEFRNQLLDETIHTFGLERSHATQALIRELAKIKQDAQAHIEAESKALKNAVESHQKDVEDLHNKQNELKLLKVELEKEKARLEQERALFEEKRKIDENKFKRIAEEEIAAEQAISKTIAETNDSLKAELRKVRLMYEELYAINDRFGDKSPEEIYSRISKLEAENQSLKMRFKNSN